VNKASLTQVYSGKSRTKAVVLFCHECMGYDGHREVKPHVKYQEAGHLIDGCTAKRCPLYPYRKGHKKDPVEIDWL